MSDRILDATVGLRSFLFDAVYENELATSEFKKASGIPWAAFGTRSCERPADFLDQRTIAEEGLDAAARDFHAGRRTATRSAYEQLFIPKPWVSLTEL